MAYHLRVVILENRWSTQLDQLVQLCRRVPIEEVILLEQSHQIRVAAYPLDKHRRMAAIFGEIGRALGRENVTCSINIASLVGHGPMPLEPEQRLPFQAFVGESLQDISGPYCILDPKWQAYAAEVCALYAAGNLDKVWIDDDFRSVSHGDRIGCFCPIHVAQVSERCGIKLTPASLAQHVAGGTGEDLAVKQAWQEVTFDGQLEAARRMCVAVKRVSPSTRLGLMNSSEPAHSVQGRDLDRLLRAFAGPEKRPLSRPGGGSYSDVLHGAVFHWHQNTALSLSVLGPDVEVVSEVENWPHTRFNKSLRSTSLQLQLHALAGADAFSLNLYDYLATPFEQEPGYEEVLRSLKEPLETIRQARQGKRLTGFGLPWKPGSALRQFSRRGRLLDIVPTREWDCFLPQMGIPVQFETAAANGIFGDAIEAYDNAEIDALLRQGLMIDGVALEHLVRRGFADLIGCASSGTLSVPTIERLDAPEFSGPFAQNLQPTDWHRAFAQDRFVQRIELRPGARSISTLVDEDLQDLAPGLVLFENASGGRVVTLPMPVSARQSLYRAKAYQIARATEWLLRAPLPVWVEDCPNVGPIYYEDPKSGEGLLAIVSGSLDPVEARLHTRLRLTDLFTGQAPADLRLEPLSVRFFRTRK